MTERMLCRGRRSFIASSELGTTILCRCPRTIPKTDDASTANTFNTLMPSSDVSIHVALSAGE